MPVESGFQVTSGFGQRFGQYAGMHWGTDFGRPGGCGGRPVFAVKAGTVTRAGVASGFGQWVTVDHPASGGGGETVYGHVIPEVTAGQSVSEGQRIARINPDSATNGGVAPHLHFEWHRYTWSPPGPDRLDPGVMLRGAAWPGSKINAPSGGGDVTAVVDWTSKFGFGNYRGTASISGICIHVTVNTPGTPCENVAAYQVSTESGSYHELVDTTGKVLVENTDDWLTWSAGPTSNARHLHRSFVMWGNESSATWRNYDLMLRAAAKRDAVWAKKYNIPVRKIDGNALRRGERGFFGHYDTTVAWGETDHVDPGPGFPWDYYLSLVRQYQGGGVAASSGKAGELTPEEHAALNDAKVSAQRAEQKVDLILDQLVGYKQDAKGRLFNGWPQLGGKTLVDAVAELLKAKEGK